MKDILNNQLVKGDIVFVSPHDTYAQIRLGRVVFSGDDSDRRFPTEVTFFDGATDNAFCNRNQLALYSTAYRNANLSHLKTLFGGN